MKITDLLSEKSIELNVKAKDKNDRINAKYRKNQRLK